MIEKRQMSEKATEMKGNQMQQVYTLNILTGELRRAGGMYISTYSPNQVDLAIEAVLNCGYRFLAMTELHVFFVKEV